MTRASRGGRRPGVVAAAVLTALLGCGLLAAPASAHVPGWSVTCETVSIDLTDYNARAMNAVTVKADGRDLLPPTLFGDAYHNSLPLPAHTAPLRVELIVQAGDDQRFSVDQTRTAPVCASASSAPSPSGSPLPSVTATLGSSPSAVAPVASPSSSGGLAQTGGSTTTPVIGGVAAAVLTAGGALLVLGRRRRARGAHAAR